MTDPPRRPPRPEVFPPPLPGALKEPFPKAKSDPPAQLSDTPPPDARRMRSTPPSGSAMLGKVLEQSEDPRDVVIRELRQTNVLYREKLTALSMPNTTPSPVPEAPRSRALVAGKVGLNLGKYTTLAIGTLGLVDVAVGLWFPEYVGPMKVLKNLVGIP